jgi:hypothetical protein
VPSAPSTSVLLPQLKPSVHVTMSLQCCFGILRGVVLLRWCVARWLLLSLCVGGCGPVALIQAVASRSLEKAAAWATKFDVPKAYGSYDELLADPDIGACGRCRDTDVAAGVPNLVASCGVRRCVHPAAHEHAPRVDDQDRGGEEARREWCRAARTACVVVAH